MSTPVSAGSHLTDRENRIDAVITWVDGDDPEHRRKRMAYQSEPMPDEGVSRKSVAETRFSATFELEYNLRLLRRNAPWLGRIFLVTDDQTPEWLDVTTRDVMGVTLVDHKEVFRDFPEYLPVFNSRSIETLLYKIPGLSERFVYLNDDFFVLRPVAETDFFDHGQVVVRGRWWYPGRWARFKRKWGEKLGKRIGGWRYSGGPLGLGREKFFFRAQASALCQLYHTPIALTRTAMKDAMESTGEAAENSRYRFRSARQVKPIVLTLNRLMLAGEARLRKIRDWYYINGDTHAGAALQKRLAVCARNPEIKMLCIQSIDQMSIQDQHRVEQYLESLLEK